MKLGIAVFLSLAFVAVLVWKSSKPDLNAINSTKTEQQDEMSMAVDIDGHAPAKK